MIASLIFGSMLAGCGRDLLQESLGPYGSWGACFVEEGDYIECFALKEQPEVSKLINR